MVYTFVAAAASGLVGLIIGYFIAFGKGARAGYKLALQDVQQLAFINLSKPPTHNDLKAPFQ